MLSVKTHASGRLRDIFRLMLLRFNTVVLLFSVLRSRVALLRVFLLLFVSFLSLPILAGAGLNDSQRIEQSNDNSPPEGGPVAISGDLTIVGRPSYNLPPTSTFFSIRYNAGAADIYEKSASGNWVHVTQLLADNGNGFEGEEFGGAVALDGDRALIGAKQSVYVFERDSTGVWVQKEKWEFPGVSIYEFRKRLALQGDLAMVGLPSDNSWAGTVRIYKLNVQDEWELQQTLTGDFTDRQEQFGASIALDGNRVLIGAEDSSGVVPPEGSAYIFELDGAGVWSKVTRLSASDGTVRGRFGFEVDLENDLAVISALGSPVEQNSVPGAVYVFERNGGGGWDELTKIVSPTAVPSDEFGVSVGLRGDTIVIGAHKYNNRKGATFIYERNNGAEWSRTFDLANENAEINHRFGRYVAVEDNTLFVNARYEGATYFYDMATPQLVAPKPGSLLESSIGEETLVWSAAFAEVTQWWLYLGSSLGALDYHDSDSLESNTLEATVTGLPDDASTVYAKLWFRIVGDNKWHFVEESYTAFGVSPELISPAAGTDLAGAVETFAWQDNGASVVQYWLSAGSSVGANDYFNSGNLANAVTVAATGLPTDGSSTVYVRLWYRLAGSTSWLFVDEEYAAGTLGGTTPEISSPAPPGPFTGQTGTEIITWIDNGSGATEYWVYAGSSAGMQDYFNSTNLGDVLNTTVINLPTNGATVWIRLWYRSGGSGAWSYIDESYTAAGSGPSIDSSSGTGLLTSPNDTFTWRDPAGNVTAWWLYVGSTVGGSEYEDSTNLGGNTSYTTTQDNLPIQSTPVYVRLWYQEGTGTPWLFVDEVFTSAP